MSEFIFMLTHHDETIPDALDYVERARARGVEWIGFKDVGLDEQRLRSLTAAIREAGARPVLEIVDVGSAAELTSVEAAARFGVDCIVGGTLVDEIVAALRGTGIRFFPYVGEVVGHPAALRGSLEDIVAEAVDVAGRPGVDGINLLAYRWAGGAGDALAAAVAAAIDVPLLAAGSVDRVERIRALDAAGAWGFTIGGAVLTGAVVPGAPFESQIDAVLAAGGAVR